MDHKAFLASVPAAERAALTETRDLPGLVHFAAHLGLIIGTGALIAMGVPLWWLLLPVQGVLIMALFMLAHECTHNTVFKTRWLNRWAGHFAGAAIGIPFRWFVYFHLAHHKWTNIPGKDPELGRAKPSTLIEWVWHVSGVSIWVALAGVLWRLARGHETPDWLPVSARAGAAREARVLIALYAATALTCLFAPMILWVWIVPIILGQPFLRLYLLAEHGDCPQVADMFDNTRTTFTNRAVRWLTWNMPYHTEHHVWPNVPFHQLPALHARMRDQLRHTADSYTQFNKAYLARRLQPSAQAGRAGETARTGEDA